ncbi:LamG-like jellyroll fold domain-containing protein [Botryobacter ruber]|uniref:LamG-like jellyroll fold domain-containing protein n=1 Tax=Botryobacter ruber TaxID=2171629 RepID=UPI000E0C0585|nr:LamG-like jellyroll fold domain-containing protein [Botryobacter ruber]
MHRHLLFILALLCFCSLDVAAQAPNLPTKGTLGTGLLSEESFSSATAVDTVVKKYPIADEYTLEVVAKVNSATGRGLDMESRNSKAKGFRLSLDAAALKWTAPLTAGSTLSGVPAGENQTIRVAVKNNQAHIYQNGTYLHSQPISSIKDIVGGVETNTTTGTGEPGPNLVAGWAGVAPDNTGRPSDYGWAMNPANTTLFNTANSGSGVRYIDINESTNRHTLNGETYVGRIMFIRWDGSSISNSSYSYPVTLEANTTYDFSLLHAYWSNSTGGRNMTVGIGKTTAAADRFATQTLSTTGTATLKRDSFIFTSQEAGTYYLTFTGDWGLFSIAALSLNKIDVAPRFIFGKNYPDGAVDMEIASVTYEEGAYAPAEVVTGPKQDLTVSGAVVNYPTTFNTNFVVNGKTELHFTAETTPFVNSSVELNSDDAWLYFDNIKPSAVIANWLRHVKVNGATAVRNTNVRTAIYKNGTVVIPNGNLTNNEALEVFTQPSLGGDSRKLAIETYHNNLGEFDNTIKSFKLRKGYMATLASNADGSGFSRVFIANEDDLVVNTMPEGLDGTVSFIRVFRWDWVSKKGKAGWDPGKINATWYYDWNISGGSNPDYDYVIIRQHGGWPSWDAINSKQNVNHLLGHNEPDRPDQANMSVDAVLAQWPEMMKSGLRIGSPAPSDPYNGWLPAFLQKAEALNYRVDFAAIHCYWGGMSPRQWYDRLLQVYNMVGKRPLWITEWNNGANWTTESWPTDKDAQFEKQLNDLKGILQVLDTASFVERYAIYDWVQEKRALVLADTLTPAGKYYAANKSNFAFSRKRAYTHTWELVAPTLASAINPGDVTKVTLSWRDLNGELGSKYIVERKIDGTETEFQPIGEITEYVAGGTVTFVDDVYDRATYRVKTLSYDEEEFKYSATLDVVRDAAATPPASLTGLVVSAKILRLNWNAGTNARSYNLKRALSPEGPFETIVPATTQLTFLDENLEPNTTYYYTVTSLNTAGESENATILELRTNELLAPTAVQSPRIASGDAKVTLTWEFQYDVTYDILRSESVNGTYEPIATNVNALRYEDSNRENGRTYYYKIVAQNAAGRSPETQVMTAMPEEGQHLYMNFNETEGVAADVWGGYHGTLSAGARREARQEGQALKLDGTANSFVSLPAGVVSSLNDITVAAWVKMDALSNWMRVFDFGTGTSTYMFLTVQAGTSGGNPVVRYTNRRGGAEAEKQLSYAYNFPLNTWTHIAVAQSGNTARMYINGALVATNTDFSNKPSELGITTQNYIGKSQYNDPLLRGSVDEFRIYNYALSEASISSLASSQPLSSGKDIASNVLVYPNPASSVINISGLDAKAYQYKVYNLVGSKVAEGTVQQGQVLLPAAIANGNYILQLTDNEKNDIRKHIVIQK